MRFLKAIAWFIWSSKNCAHPTTSISRTSLGPVRYCPNCLRTLP